MREHPSGTRLHGHLIPEKWTCREGVLETLDGRRLAGYADHPLHVASYSHPFAGEVAREDLLRRLRVLPGSPDAVPYRRVSEQGEWGICCGEALRGSLTEDAYRVRIDTDFSFGSLKTGELRAPGRTGEEIALCCHIGRAGMAGYGLSGLAVGLSVLRDFARRGPGRRSLLLLAVSSPLGVLAHLAGRGRSDRPAGLIFLDWLGRPDPLSLRPLSDPSGPFVRECRSAAAGRADFTDATAGSPPDASVLAPLLERSGIPALELCRAPGSPRPVLSSLDRPETVSREALEAARAGLTGILEALGAAKS